jgi:hypothetical protein
MSENYLLGIGTSGFTNLLGTEYILLNNSVFYPSYVEPDILEHKSIINGVKNFIDLGDYSSFKVVCHVWKWENTLRALQDLMTYNHEDVYFYPHIHKNAIGDFQGPPMKDSTGTSVKFHITLMRPFYFEYSGLHEKKVAVEIEFKAMGYTDISKNIT